MIDEKMRIGGKKVDGENGTIDVFNPFNGEKVGSVPRASTGQVNQTMEIAKNFPEISEIFLNISRKFPEMSRKFIELFKIS